MLSHPQGTPTLTRTRTPRVYVQWDGEEGADSADVRAIGEVVPLPACTIHPSDVPSIIFFVIFKKVSVCMYSYVCILLS